MLNSIELLVYFLDKVRAAEQFEKLYAGLPREQLELKKREWVNAQDHTLITPLQYACFNGNLVRAPQPESHRAAAALRRGPQPASREGPERAPHRGGERQGAPAGLLPGPAGPEREERARRDAADLLLRDKVRPSHAARKPRRTSS